MKNKINIFILSLSSLAVLVFYQNCSNGMTPLDLSQQEVPVQNISAAEAESRSLAILQNRCAVCHSAEMGMGEINYITDVNALQYYRLVVKFEPLLSPLYTVLIDNENHMSLLSQTEIETVFKWISDGLGNGGVGGVAPPPTVQLQPTFASIRANVIGLRCAGCHIPGAGNNNMVSGNLNMSTYQTLMQSAGVVVPGSPQTSRLIDRITNDNPGANRPRMPRNGTPLSAQDISIITQWIQNGAQNN